MQKPTIENSCSSDQGKPQPVVTDVRPVVFPSGRPVVIRIEQIWKQYRLGVINHGTLARDLQSWWARLLGNEDPNLPLIQVASGKEVGDRFWALQDVSFDVCQGDVFGIVGKNGAGKSTLLKILSQVTAPTRGQVKIKGRVASLLEVGTGFHPELTGRENIFLNGAILGMSKQEISRKLDEIIAFAEIDKFIDTPVKRYSSGMYVRLAFAVAAHLEPEVLIVDEVLAVGDLQFQKKCLGKMKEVSTQQGRTVLFVSHNLDAVKKLCGPALMLKDGKVICSGPSTEVVAAYEETARTPLRQTPAERGLLYRNDACDRALHDILELHVTSGSNNPVESLQTLGAATIRIRFHAPVATINGSVGIFLSTLDGRMLLRWVMSPDCGQTMAFHPGDNEVACRIEALPLAAGEYLLSAGLSDPPRDWLCFRELAVVKVITADVFDSGVPPAQPNNLVVVPCRWETPG